ncbi:MAG TPA: anaerobic glycerol-3-phosphate dehydrogenase subunit C [Desulfobacteria bacterium]|nr:anaerobic glycerol-3-phosphate dehydrogenase subunit C [Desulfobacteria bacterium]
MKNTREERAFNLDNCIKCGGCTAECPVAAVNPLFPGPKLAGPDAERFRLEGESLDSTWLDYCSNCKTCELTCPFGVRITDIIRRAKETKRGNGKAPLRDKVLGRVDYIGRLGTIWPGLTNSVLRLSLTRLALRKVLKFSSEAPFPAYQRRFVAGKERYTGLNRGKSGVKKRVVFFPGCFINYNDRTTGEAVVRVLEHNGFEVIIPKFRCCGVPREANGDFAGASGNARYNLALMQPYLAQGYPIITACPSCGLALKAEYPRLDVPAAKQVGAQTYDLFEFLWKLYRQGELHTGFAHVDLAVGYHAPCHLKAQGIGTPSVRLLSRVLGVKISELDAGCCGLSGSFGFKLEKYNLAMQIGSGLFARAKYGFETGEFTLVCSECGACRTQIEHGSGVTTLHPVHILAKAYGLT